jgi:4-aminobutyrate aminotransferase/(S)-3-amino-2-methylpropionate transaminase
MTLNTWSGRMTTNADLFARRQAAVIRGVGNASPLSAARALNSEIWDVEGKRYVDFGGGIAVVNTGHCHPRIMEAVRKQLDCFTHTCFQVIMYEPYIDLAERLNALAPISGAAKSILFTTGAEATENAIRSRAPRPVVQASLPSRADSMAARSWQ